jgi:hypothetical protein
LARLVAAARRVRLVLDDDLLFAFLADFARGVDFRGAFLVI